MLSNERVVLMRVIGSQVLQLRLKKAESTRNTQTSSRMCAVESVSGTLHGTLVVMARQI